MFGRSRKPKDEMIQDVTDPQERKHEEVKNDGLKSLIAFDILHNIE